MMTNTINSDDLKELAPTGVLRGGVVVAPVASALFAVKDAKGVARGVTVTSTQPLEKVVSHDRPTKSRRRRR